jgi:hypothetical protein
VAHSQQVHFIFGRRPNLHAPLRLLLKVAIESTELCRNLHISVAFSLFWPESVASNQKRSLNKIWPSRPLNVVVARHLISNGLTSQQRNTFKDAETANGTAEAIPRNYQGKKISGRDESHVQSVCLLTESKTQIVFQN